MRMDQLTHYFLPLLDIPYFYLAISPGGSKCKVSCGVPSRKQNFIRMSEQSSMFMSIIHIFIQPILWYDPNLSWSITWGGCKNIIKKWWERDILDQVRMPSYHWSIIFDTYIISLIREYCNISIILRNGNKSSICSEGWSFDLFLSNAYIFIVASFGFNLTLDILVNGGIYTLILLCF